MKTDQFLIFCIIFFGFLAAFLIAMEIGLISYIACKLGKHTFKNRRTSSYRCLYCGEPKKHPHLKVIQGGKKYIERTFKW